MEAYCLGSGHSHPDHPHTVTEEDFKKLDRQRMLQKSLPRKHENAINVLRAKQERDIRNRRQKQDEELGLTDTTYQRDRNAEAAKHTKDLENLETIIEVRRKRLLQRWDLKLEIWRKEWEHEHGTSIDLQLEHETWPLSTNKTMTPITDTSSLAPYVQAAA